MTGMEEQLCLFTEELPDTAEAVSVWTGYKAEARKPYPWMLRLVSDGVYVLGRDDKHPLVLRPVPYGVDGIQKGHEFMHFTIGGQLYAGIFVGRSDG